MAATTILAQTSLDREALWHDIQQIRNITPLVHNITNLVVMQQTANALLALGASPLMTHNHDELKEIVGISHALVLNIGTLNDDWIEGMLQAQAYAKQRKIPIVLDPVAAGASQLRTQIATDILKAEVSIVRGNAGEIMALAGDAITSGGVDSLYQSHAAVSAATSIATTYNCTVIVSGEVDQIISPSGQTNCAYGSPLMAKITGMGCTATALVGAFAAINNNAAEAALHAMATMGIAGSLSAKIARAPGSFAVAFFDNLYNLTFDDIPIGSE